MSAVHQIWRPLVKNHRGDILRVIRFRYLFKTVRVQPAFHAARGTYFGSDLPKCKATPASQGARLENTTGIRPDYLGNRTVKRVPAEPDSTSILPL
jgi:hypothetical protein